jgi:hypothetical protein
MVRDHDPRLYYRPLLGPRCPPPIIWSTRRFGCGWQQPRTTRIIAERLATALKLRSHSIDKLNYYDRRIQELNSVSSDRSITAISIEVVTLIFFTLGELRSSDQAQGCAQSTWARGSRRPGWKMP